nr:hypothetical protein [Agromyces seonyuensis]
MIGAVDRAYPVAVAGTARSWSWEDGVFTLVTEPDASASAPTELYLPDSIGDDVHVEGAEILEWDAASRILQLEAPAGESEITVVVSAG